MRVALLSRGVYPRLLGGREIFIRELALALVNRGCAVDLVTEHGAGALIPGVRVVPVATPGVRGIDFAAYVAGFGMRSLRILNGVDLVHVHSPGANMLLAGFAARTLDVPFVITLHSMASASRRWGPVIRNADAVIAVSLSLAARIEEEGVPRERIHVIPAASASPRYHESRRAVRAKLNLAENHVVFLYHGRLAPGKGLERAVEAFAALRNGEARLLILGDGSLRPALEAQLRAARLEGRGQCLGAVPHDRIWDFLSAADVALLPSESEGSPLALFEAMAAGLPVVVADAPGLRDVVVEGDNGLLVRGTGTLPLTTALRRLVEDADLRASLAARSRAAAQRNTIDVCAARHIELYERLVAR